MKSSNGTKNVSRLLVDAKNSIFSPFDYIISNLLGPLFGQLYSDRFRWLGIRLVLSRRREVLFG